MALRQLPEDASAHLDLAEALYQAQRLEDAEKSLEAALDIDAAAIAVRPVSQQIRNAIFSRRRAEERPQGPPPPLLARLLASVPDLPGPGKGLPINPGLILALALAYVAARVLPPCATRQLLADDMADIAGSPLRGGEDVRDRLRHAVRARGLGRELNADDCEVETGAQWRRIVCRYDVDVQFLPGVAGKLRFHIDVERPYLAPADTIQVR
jgi:hypothetical protein